ncbi:hypothetical protein J1TS1_41940 [Shouchella clausii]|nr:hypothetical protein J1TS1_41940 [Shouchella clausii]
MQLAILSLQLKKANSYDVGVKPFIAKFKFKYFSCSLTKCATLSTGTQPN